MEANATHKRTIPKSTQSILGFNLSPCTIHHYRTDPTYEAIATSSSQELTPATEKDQPDSSSRSEDVIKVSMLRKAVNINWGILCQSRPRIVMKASICVYNRILPSTIQQLYRTW